MTNFIFIFFCLKSKIKYIYHIFNISKIIVYSFKYYFIFFLFGIIISGSFSYHLYKNLNDSPPLRFEFLISIISFAFSLLWVWFSANNLISLITTLGDLLNIPSTFLGITVLAFGNCISDSVLNLSLVKSGYGEMALTGSIAGSLFNLLVGLGISLIKINLIEGNVIINMKTKENILSLIGMIFLLFNLVRLLIQVGFNKYKLDKSISYVGFFIYFSFILIVICFTFFL